MEVRPELLTLEERTVVPLTEVPPDAAVRDVPEEDTELPEEAGWPTPWLERDCPEDLTVVPEETPL